MSSLGSNFIYGQNLSRKKSGEDSSVSDTSKWEQLEMTGRKAQVLDVICLATRGSRFGAGFGWNEPVRLQDVHIGNPPRIAPLPNPLLFRIPKLFQVSDSKKLFRFLQIRDHLVNVLIDMQEQLQVYFGEHAPLTLRVIDDPDSGSQRIVVNAGTTASVETAQQQLRRFDIEWWVPNIGPQVSDVTVDVQYI